jgi:hypothetical protein
MTKKRQADPARSARPGFPKAWPQLLGQCSGRRIHLLSRLPTVYISIGSAMRLGRNDIGALMWLGTAACLVFAFFGFAAVAPKRT